MSVRPRDGQNAPERAEREGTRIPLSPGQGPTRIRTVALLDRRARRCPRPSGEHPDQPIPGVPARPVTHPTVPGGLTNEYQARHERPAQATEF